MNADPATQLRLLDLQSADTALARLAHRRRTLPEIAELAEREKEASRLHDELVEAQTRSSDIAGEQQRLEADVETVRARTARDEKRLQEGGLPSRELENLQHEVTTLARRKSTLEDELLEVMERAETAQSDIDRTGAAQAAVTTEIGELATRRDRSLADIDTGTDQRTCERAELAGTLPGDLLALYERTRAHSGTGAALLRLRRCEGCHIELSGSELAAVRSAGDDVVVRCENCRAVLVRTAESGL